MSKKYTMKYKFFKDKLLVYLGTFTLPVLLIGTLSLMGMYARERNKVQDKMRTSLNLTVDYVNSFYADAEAFELYLSSGQRMSQFYNMFQKEKVDYDAANALRYLSAYMVSLKSARTDIHSIYFYLNNPSERVVTSEKFTETAACMEDQGWMETLLSVKGDETCVKVREYGNEHASKQKIFSVFRGYPNYNGGIVINYNLNRQRKKIQQMTFYDGQIIILLDEKGNLLFSNKKIEEEKETELSLWIEKHPRSEEVSLNNKNYMVDIEKDAAGMVQVISLVPQSAVSQMFLSNMKNLIFLVLVIAAASVWLAYDRVARSYRQLYSIIDIFDRAEKGQQLPEPIEEDSNMHGHILNNIIRTFLENSYLKVQLSERKYRQMSAQMLALQYQISPHFLFNTLQAINYEILSATDGKPGKANAMVENLSDLMRYALDSSRQEISIREEIEICKKYVDIQRMRQDRKIGAEWEIDPEVEGMEIQRMLLQPLIENSLSHGLKFKDEGRIRVAVRKEKDRICFKVMDNGEGISREKINFLNEWLDKTKNEFEAEHIGLTNVNQRLLLSYGNDAGIHIFSIEGIGTIQYFSIRRGK